MPKYQIMYQYRYYPDATNESRGEPFLAEELVAHGDDLMALMELAAPAKGHYVRSAPND